MVETVPVFQLERTHAKTSQNTQNIESQKHTIKRQSFLELFKKWQTLENSLKLKKTKCWKRGGKMGETVPVFLISLTHLNTSQNLRLCRTTKRYAFTSCSPFSFFKMAHAENFLQLLKIVSYQTSDIYRRNLSKNQNHHHCYQVDHPQILLNLEHTHIFWVYTIYDILL